MFIARNADGGRARPRDTVAPLPADLGIKIDLSCDRDDTECVQDVVDGYKGNGNILIWYVHPLPCPVASVG